MEESPLKETLKDSPRARAKSAGSHFRLEPEVLVKIHNYMVKARVLEERLIRMYKQSDGYFWIGGPGEEAFNVPLGLQVHKGQGLDHDFLHLHYRSAAILTAMGLQPVDAIRQMKNTVTDPFSGGRNFSNHYSVRAWNVVPVSSTIETQYATAIGTGIAQKSHGGKGITIVNGGDAGTAEGEFASCLVWSSRPNKELPILIVVTNNEWGISTSAATQHGEKKISDRAKAFGIKSATINGNDVEESWFMIQEAMDYIRTERKPFMLEARVSRLYGHSSATGCNFVTEEADSLALFESKLEAAGILSRKEMDQLREAYNAEMLELSQQVKQEPMPDPSTIYDHTYFGQKGRYW
ncbi:thiamine pyrophosphate-dependent dehydrogenase E1 component subunit alpha [bacterium]|jgi:2-oxoisovalerate dehydrogenase E1 component alpha subunit|nr:thiamine pyrophosphate-dependent dehydrogenase E1 component subunit alpha [bacterium]